jgi:hypothetical protein
MNPLGVVSMVEVPNNPRLLTGGVSELYDLTDIQDRINKTRSTGSDPGVRRRPAEVGEGVPDEDDDGNPNTSSSAATGWSRRTSPRPRSATSTSRPLDPYSLAKREDVKDIASRSRTPAQYLLGEMSNVNGETLKASESGLISKVKQRMRPFGEAAEETMRIARRAANLPDVDGARMETIWTNPQYRTEGELTDAVIKRVQSGHRVAAAGREDVGYSATQIEQLERTTLGDALGTVRTFDAGGSH